MACGIKTADKIIITGGYEGSVSGFALKTVTSYTKNGQTETLRQLNIGRYHHACGSYHTDGGDEVRLVLNIDKCWIIVMQVLLVTGGYNHNDGDLASTEVMEAGGTWRLTASLPSARNGLRAAVVNNNIFVFGENNLRYINIEHIIAMHCIL